MKVLSLFDGISAGQLALQRAGIAVDAYYASEVDKYAISVTQKNFPDTIQLGDVTKWREWDIPWGEIDLVIGGSPCQGFSFAGKQLNFDDPRSALFFVFVDICHRVADDNPKMRFMLENVRMKKEYQDVISGYFGVQPIAINSSLVSAQNRYRLYWTNIPNVTQPDDRGILLRDILEQNVDSKYDLSLAKIDRVLNTERGKGFFYSSDTHDKSGTLIAGYYKEPTDGVYIKQPISYLVDKKYYLSPEAIDYMGRLRNGKPRWEYHKNNLDSKAACLTANMHKGVPYGVVKDIMRKLTPIECERLQTFPDNWTKGISDTQRYKALGNSWTVDVVAHIFKNL